MAGLDVDEWCFEYWGVDALGGPDCAADRTSRPRSRSGPRGAAPTNARRRVVGRELVPLTLSAPPAGFTGMGRQGGGRPNELLGIWPTLVDQKLVDENVRVTIEEVT